MKSKILATVLVLALAAALIAGATSAWFTDDAELPETVFTAGSLKINVDAPTAITDHITMDNVNPGDCATLCWSIENTGSKKAEIRAKVTGNWVDLVPEDSEPQVAFFAPKGENWAMYKDGEDIYLYYVKGPLEGTYEGDTGGTVELCLVVAFDGLNMGNEYQKEKYKLKIQFEAVQTTNGAPEDVWEIRSLDDIKEGIGEFVEDYFTVGRGADSPCWNGNNPQHEISITIEGADEIDMSGYGRKTSQYTATVKINDCVDESAVVTWGLIDPPRGVTIDGSGLLSVNKNVSQEEITISASYTDASGEKVVQLYKCNCHS